MASAMLLGGALLALRIASWLGFFAWLLLLDAAENVLRATLGAAGACVRYPWRTGEP